MVTALASEHMEASCDIGRRRSPALGLWRSMVPLDWEAWSGDCRGFLPGPLEVNLFPKKAGKR